MIKSILTLSTKTILSLLIAFFLYANYTLYYHPHFKETADGTFNQDLYHQLQFLKEEIHKGTADSLQNQFPEGFVFFNALYGLSWCGLIESIDQSSEIYREGITEIDFAISEVFSQKAKETFTKDLPLTYGAFYNGWTNYLLGKKLKLTTKTSKENEQLFRQNCAKIAKAVNLSKTPYLETYQESAWSPDMVVCIATLRLHDELFSPQYTETITKWIAKVKEKLDPKTGLIPHYVNATTGETIDGARGSSQSLMLCFLKDIDKEFALKQFDIYKRLFLERRFGLPGIREYPKGTKGTGDIDSGPVIYDIGGAATIVGQRAMGIYDDWKNYEALRNNIETFGLGITKKTKKKYIFGRLPIADAFIAWSNSLENNEKQVVVKGNWRWRFQLLSLIIIIFAGLILWKMKK